MRARLVVIVALAVFLAACGQQAGGTADPVNSVAPSATAGSSSAIASDAELPFHSEISWTSKTVGYDVALCSYPPPVGKAYIMRNTNKGTHVTTHLGTGDYENHTCVYGVAGGPPEGWIADVHWTAANGDVLHAKSVFQYWTGAVGKSTAIDTFTFENGGTGRFEFVEGGGTAFVDTQTRLAGNDGVIRFGKKVK